MDAAMQSNDPRLAATPAARRSRSGRAAIGVCAAIAFVAVGGCEPTRVVVKEPVIERVLVVPELAGASSRSREPLELEDVRAIDSIGAAPPRALTADTDPSRIEGGTLSSQGPGTFACTIPGNRPAWCAKAANGPFVLTDLRTTPACGDTALVAALTGQMTDASRWTMRGPIDLHGARLLLRGDEWLFIGAVATGAEPEAAATRGKRKTRESEPPSSEARCAVTWSGFRPYSADDLRMRPLERGLDIPPLDTLHGPGKRNPREGYERDRTALPVPFDPGF
jgi:hypothetical protein